jgi:hypothetical protein
MSTSAGGQRASWGVFGATAPDLSEQVKAAFERDGQPFGYLATLRPDGAPRVHPVTPMITSGGLFCMVLPPGHSPGEHYVTARDLQRDGRYALHAGKTGDADAEACLAGWAMPVATPRHATFARAQRGGLAEGQLFEFTIALAIVTRRDPAGSRASQVVWRPP